MRTTKLCSATRLYGAVAFVSAAAFGGFALADEYERVSPVRDQLTAKECSACHMIFPAGLLPASSWKTMMADLKNHFGANAELDADSAGKITQYLVNNAAREGRGTVGDRIRISEQPWFVNKHDKKGRISPATLKRRGAKSVADCKACHLDAERGYFEDD